MPRGRPNRGRVTIAVNVTPDTRLTLRRLAAEQDTTQGDIIDALIQKEMTEYEQCKAGEIHGSPAPGSTDR